MRNFKEADRKKKDQRIHLPENPGNLSMEIIAELENTVKVSLIEGHLSCPVAWRIAKDQNVPRIAIGEIADRLDIRITNCQLGCFNVDKTPHDTSVHKNISGQDIALLETLYKKDQLTCAMVFDIARQFNLKPIDVSNEMSARGMKIHSCQLGCF